MSIKDYSMKKWVFTDIFFGLLVGIVVFANYVKPQFRAEGRKGTYVRWDRNTYQLIRNGNPYYIKGGAIDNAAQLSDLAKSGANSVRVYSTENASAILDSAEKLGITVMLGIKLPKAKTEADYSDTSTVNGLVSMVRQEVMKYKDHPALLCWGLGNEVDLFEPFTVSNMGKSLMIWKVMNRLAAVVKEHDPLHPVATSVPSRRFKLIFIYSFVPNIDLVALNAFSSYKGGVFYKALERVGLAGLKGPHVYSEFGAEGYWDTERTGWYSKLEQSSREKALYLEDLYTEITGRRPCLGTYAFYFGYKQEFTPTWYSMYTRKGEPVEVLRGLSSLWNRGHLPEEAFGSISGVWINNQDKEVYTDPGKRVRLRFSVDDPAKVSGGYLEIRKEADYLLVDQITQELELKQETSFKLDPDHSTHYLDFDTPAVPGAFRAYVFVRQKSGFISTANICFYVLE